MNSRLDGSQSLRQGRRFSVSRNHEKGSQPLQKHRNHRRLHLAGQLVESLNLFENWIELGRSDEVCRPLHSYSRKDGTDDWNSPTDFLKGLFVESISFS